MSNKFVPSLTAVYLLCAGMAYAGSPTIEDPIYRYGTPTAVLVSTGSYTKVPATSSLSHRTALLVDNTSTNTAIMHGHIGNCTSTSVSTSTVLGPIEIAPSTNGGIIPIGSGSDVCLWIVTRHTSAENITVQEISQRQGP